MFGFYELAFFAILGAIFGSFITCLTYRLPKGIILHGRSICPRCHTEIAWYDNIPLLSYVLLKARCRACHKRISLRYPLIELTTGILFSLIYFLYSNCSTYYFCTWRGFLGSWTLPFLLFNIVLILTIFIIDWERTIIPDEIVFLGFVSGIVVFALSGQDFYERFLSAFAASSFLLFLNLVTRGRGMGLGDVKFALYGGIFFTLPVMITWMFGAFVIGAAVGLLLIFLGKARFGAKIPFGPFLAASLVLTLIWGNNIKLIPI